ncbi:uncharacterized protein LOC115757062 [Rhodamnia argentea]|uniref:Uncharacterized protein LOC115757062 n=1 Tax=Rhodamnia argentea TaxID=178133 RepID=A0A8B8R3F7_9MYRT|nr:uncharacterized protein LOC115757062 [Rhodamnia argentea]
MKKLYRRSVTVHPSPPPAPPAPPIYDHNHLLSLLPAAILALTAALSPQDREVLAYLVSSYNNNHFNNRGKNRSSNCDHPPCFTCDCFRCYMSYWVRWDSSPNRQLIHEVIDAFEDGLVLKSKGKNHHRGVKGKNGRDRRNRSGLGAAQPAAEPKGPEPSPAKSESADKKEEANSGGGEVGSGGEEELEKGSVRRLVSFIGERIWSAWN